MPWLLLSLTLANTLYVPGDFNPLHGSSMYPFLLMFLLPFSKKSQPPLYLADFLPIPSTKLKQHIYQETVLCPLLEAWECLQHAHSTLEFLYQAWTKLTIVALLLC